MIAERFLRWLPAWVRRPRWTREAGPTCTCGRSTYVQVDGDGRADLVCVFHEAPGGCIWALPRERPPCWPDLSNQEMRVLVERGAAERDQEEEDEHGH